MDYDDETELTRYVWDHFFSLMTEFERCVGLAIIGRMKVEHMKAAALQNSRALQSCPALGRLLNERWGRVGDPEIDAALAEGAETFRRRTCRRVLTERGSEVFINRCARCGRVVRTPRAQQCFWCGYDWHEFHA